MWKNHNDAHDTKNLVLLVQCFFTGVYLKQYLLNISASFADLGIILPLVLGVSVATGMNTGFMLIGLGIFALISGIVYRRPIPAQPMKVVAALAIVGQLNQQAVIATGLLMGLIVLILGITGLAGHLKKLISSTILLGIQASLAISLLLTALPLIEDSLFVALILLGIFIVLKKSLFHPIAFISVFAVSLYIYGESPQFNLAPSIEWELPVLFMPGIEAFMSALKQAFLPQLALTLTNALLLTAAIAHDYYPEDKTNITENKLALSTGGLNLLLAPLGAVPMCHGAGGLVAYHTAGGRNGLPVIVLGIVLIGVGLLTGSAASWYLDRLPEASFGVLLLITATYVVEPKKLLKESLLSRFIILLIIGLTIIHSILVGLVAGLLFEYLSRIMSRYRQNQLKND